MKGILPVLLGTCALVLMLCSCTNPGLAMRDLESEFERDKKMASQSGSSLTSFIKTNYQFYLKTGQAKNEQEARALAALDWEKKRHRTKMDTK